MGSHNPFTSFTHGDAIRAAAAGRQRRERPQRSASEE
jgi:hypothetical protein